MLPAMCNIYLDHNDRLLKALPFQAFPATMSCSYILYTHECCPQPIHVYWKSHKDRLITTTTQYILESFSTTICQLYSRVTVLPAIYTRVLENQKDKTDQYTIPFRVFFSDDLSEFSRRFLGRHFVRFGLLQSGINYTHVCTYREAPPGH